MCLFRESSRIVCASPSASASPDGFVCRLNCYKLCLCILLGWSFLNKIITVVLLSFRSQYHPRPKRYSQYLQLAISIIIDQRLGRPPRIVPWKTHVGSNVDEQAEPAQPPPTQPNDIQRAISGCYYLSSR